MAQGYGGVTATAAATGLARSTINRGIRELQSASKDIGDRVRRPGGGTKSAVAHQPGLPAALEALIEDAIRGDPSSPLRWVSRSLRHLVKALAEQGFEASQRVVANLLRELKYSCQANRKTREGTSHPDRDAQFAHINATVTAALAAGEPAISVDTKYARIGIMHGFRAYREQTGSKCLAARGKRRPAIRRQPCIIQSPSRNARISLVGRNLCALTDGACKALSARSFIARSASTYMWVVAVLS